MKKLVLLVFFLLFSFTLNDYFKNNSHENSYVQMSDAILKKYIPRVAKKYKLQVVMIGGGMQFDINEIALEFTSSIKNLNIEQARRIILDCSEDLLKRYNSNSKIRPYLSNFPFSANNLMLGIGFITESNDNNFICQVSVMDNTIFYHVRNINTNSLEKIYQEPYEEALRIVKEEKALEQQKAKPTVQHKKAKLDLSAKFR